MSKLRNSIIKSILDNLEHGDFCAEDFDAKFLDTNTANILAEITFKALPKYSFVLEETRPLSAVVDVMSQENHKMIIRTIEKPGEYKNNEQIIHDDIYSAINRVSSWVTNIRDDLIHSRATVRSSIDELTENFQKSIDENIKDPGSYFEESEEDDIKSKLDELQARVTELESKLGISKKDTKKIQTVIDKSKSDLKIYPKGVWYKTAGTKIFKVIKEVLKTKEGREALTVMAKKLLQ